MKLLQPKIDLLIANNPTENIYQAPLHFPKEAKYTGAKTKKKNISCIFSIFVAAAVQKGRRSRSNNEL